MGKIKTLLLVPDLRGDGGVTNLYNTLALDKATKLHYFAVNKPKQQSRFATVFRLFKNYLLFIYYILKFDYKLIHVNPSLDPRSFYRDAVFIIISKLLRRNVLVTFHGWLEDFEQQINNSKARSLLFKISFAKADKFIVLGSTFKNKLIKMGVPRCKDIFIETTVADASSIDELDLPKKLDSFKSKVVFLFLSKVAKTKGIYISLDAYKEFADKHPHRTCCLLVAGDGPELNDVKQYVEDTKINNVIFFGHISGAEKRKALLESHIMLLPSYTEGLPNSILEGMLYGMPIISRATGGIPDIIQNDVNGFISESYNPSDYVRFMEYLELDPKKYERIAKENNRIAQLAYATEKVRENVLRIYNSF